MILGVEGVKPPAWGRSPQTPFLQLIKSTYLKSAMTVLQIIPVCAWLLGILLLWAVPVQAQPGSTSFDRVQSVTTSVLNLQEQQRNSPETVVRQLAKANVIYLGETHDEVADHQAQLEIIRSLHQQNPNLAIGMEMFQRPYQSVLDDYIAGQLTETQLREQTQFDKRWGFSWDYYAPILQFAKENKLPLIALNTPAEITRKVARQGLESLTPTERKWIPAASDIRTDNSDYRQLMQRIYDEIHAEMGNSQSFEKFFLAQVLWDETMADGVSQFLQTNPKTQVVVLAGQGHIVYGYGIPSRVARRIKEQHRSPKSFSQKLILLNPSEEIEKMQEGTIADYFWYSSQ
jgi:uncharacterized iron-regulated protein